MKCYYIFLVVLLLYKPVFAQVSYNVDIESRNKVIDLNKQADKLILETQMDSAIEVLTQSVKVDSVLRETYLLVFKAWKTDGECSDWAVRLLKKGIRIFERDDELCYYVAEVYRGCSKYPEAVLEYTNAVVYAKENGSDFFLVPFYYFNRAGCFYQMGMYDGAIADYSEMLKLKPDFGAAYNNRGICYYLAGRKREACHDWNKAVELEYRDASGYIEKYCGEK